MRVGGKGSHHKAVLCTFVLYNQHLAQQYCNIVDPTGICRQFNGITEKAKQL